MSIQEKQFIFSCPSNVGLLNKSLSKFKNESNNNLWRFSYPLDINNNTNNIKWKNGIILKSKSCSNLLNSYSKSKNDNSNNINSNINIRELNDLLEPRPIRSTKLEGKIKERLGKLLNNEMLEKQGKAIGKAATIYEENLLKSKERAKKFISSYSSSTSIIIVN